MPDSDAHTAWLSNETDVAGFRSAARSLIAQGIEPQRVSWQIANAVEGDLFAATPPNTPDDAHRPELAPLRLPPALVALCERAALHRNPQRHALLYRLVWRLAHERGLRDDPLDPDRLQIELLARAVRRDMHKMTAFVRFRPLSPPSVPGSDAWRVPHVAWFEPQHHIVEATAPFFARRFAQMPWAILTPERSARWDGRQLAFGPGATREDAPPADADERLWLTYYESIFNPARLKLSMMQKEMPRRYWKNLPEAALITSLTAQSAQRHGQMIEQGGSDPVRRRPAASLALRLEHRVDVRAQGGDAPGTLAALRAATERCRACPIGHSATQSVGGEGAPRARLMLVGEQPGDQEDLHGRPFVGPAGQLLDRALAQLGWPRDSLYLTNAVKHFKFELRGKRRIHKTAAQHEAAACLDWLEHEIALVKPEAIIALGATAARSLLGRTVGIGQARGKWLMRADGLRVLIAGHPSALLRMERADFDAAFAAWIDDLRQAGDLGSPAPGATAPSR